MVLQSEGLKNVVKLRLREGGCQKPFKTKSFKKVLCLKVSGQGKLEFESDLSKMLIKQKNIDEFAKTLLSLQRPYRNFQKPIKLMKFGWC